MQIELEKFNRGYLYLLRKISISQFKNKDQSTFFGFMWSFLHPILLLMVMYVVFNFKFGDRIEHYPIYLLIGIVHYNYFSSTSMSAMKVLDSMKQLTRNAIFPKEILVFATVIANTIEFIISMSICIILAYIAGINLTLFIIFIPLVLILEILLVMWISLIISTMYMFVKDIGHIYQVFLRALFFLTPIFYTLSQLGDGFARKIALLNPLTYIMTFTRSLVLKHQFFEISHYTIILIFNLVLLIISIMVFRKYEIYFAENT